VPPDLGVAVQVAGFQGLGGRRARKGAYGPVLANEFSAERRLTNPDAYLPGGVPTGDDLGLGDGRAVPLRDVRFDDLQVWVTGLTMGGSVRFEGGGLSASRVRQAHQLVSAVLKFAVKAKHLPANPADGVELPRLPESEQLYLTHEQLHLVAIASGQLRTLILILGYCGLRFGEATALRVSDIDLHAQRIRVRRSVTYVRKVGLVEGPTKNHTSRTVPVPAFVNRLLATELAGRGTDALVFESARGGGHLTLGQARYRFGKAVATVGGINKARIHDLRHTCASLAISAGANVKVVQRLLGHKTAVLTLDRYGHLFPDDLDAVAIAFDTAAQSAADRLRTDPQLKSVAAGPVSLRPWWQIQDSNLGRR
jgi:integrase